MRSSYSATSSVLNSKNQIIMYMQYVATVSHQLYLKCILSKKKVPATKNIRMRWQMFHLIQMFLEKCLISLHKLLLQLFDRGKMLVRLGVYSVCYNKNYPEPKQATMAGINLPWKQNSWLQNQQLSFCNLFLFYSVNYVFIFVTLCLKHYFPFLPILL